MEALQFPIGQLYLIVTKNNYALKIDDPNKHDKSRISTSLANPQDVNQLFFVEKVKGDDVEIVNAVSGLAFDEEKG